MADDMMKRGTNVESVVMAEASLPATLDVPVTEQASTVNAARLSGEGLLEAGNFGADVAPVQARPGRVEPIVPSSEQSHQISVAEPSSPERGLVPTQSPGVIAWTKGIVSKVRSIYSDLDSHVKKQVQIASASLATAAAVAGAFGASNMLLQPSFAGAGAGGKVGISFFSRLADFNPRSGNYEVHSETDCGGTCYQHTLEARRVMDKANGSSDNGAGSTTKGWMVVGLVGVVLASAALGIMSKGRDSAIDAVKGWEKNNPGRISMPFLNPDLQKHLPKGVSIGKLPTVVNDPTPQMTAIGSVISDVTQRGRTPERMERGRALLKGYKGDMKQLETYAEGRYGLQGLQVLEEFKADPR